MQLLNHLSRLSQRVLGSRAAAQTNRPQRPRLCRVEQFEPRLPLAGDLHVGAVYFEGDLGADVEGDTIQITFEGGQPNTQATRLVIDGDKDGNGLSIGDLFFDIAPGGMGAFNSGPLVILSHDGFEVLGTSVVDGGTELAIDVSGFDPGEKLVLTIDVDELQYVDPVTGEQDTNAIVEGAEFQRAKLIATFAAPHFFDATGTGRFFDHFDENFAAAERQTGLSLNLPDDAWSGGDDQSDRTAGAVLVMQQTPLPITLSGTVFEDVNLDNTQQSGDPGIVGVQLSLLIFEGGSYVATGKTATTDQQGNYRFEGLLPGRYRIEEAQPSGYVSVGATAGNVGGQTRGVVASVDVLSQIDLLGGEDSADNDFAEARPASLAGNVYHDRNNNGLLQSGEEGIGTVTIRVIPLVTVGTPTGPIDVVSRPDGSWSAGGLNPGNYRVIEVTQPTPYLDGLDAAGNAGGAAVNPGDEINGIRLTSGQAGINYNFGEILPNRIAGRVHAGADGDCEYEPGDVLLEGVIIELRNEAGQLIATTTTDSQGQYEFTGLRPGTYTVFERQPADYIDGEEHVGSAGGAVLADDTLGQIVLVSGTNGVNYDFCEHVLLDLCGNVYVDDDNDGVFDASEPGIGGVTVRLLDANGNPTGATTLTAADGSYCFMGLRPGTYGVAEDQPSEYLDGLDTPGNAGGTAQNPGDRIVGAVLVVGLNGRDYNFGELRPSSISGMVHADTDGDCEHDPGEVGLAGVRIDLLDAAGNILRTMTTDEHGEYRFDRLAPGVYTVREEQPQGYFDGEEHPGSAGGLLIANDTLGNIRLGPGVDATEYDFCEFPPGSIAGRVHADLDDDCVYDEGEPLLAGVRLSLIDRDGNVVQTTLTDAAGEYRFDNLPPGEYSVREEQPEGYFDGEEEAGTAGGAPIGNDTIAGINLLPGFAAVHYDFCEIPPTSLCGFVYHDRNNNGQREAGEEGIAGVELVLLDAQGNSTGTRTTTAEDGAYCFMDLLPGIYGVREAQPSGWFDGLDTPGTSGGTAVNPGDTLLGADLRPTVGGMEYNFGELAPASLRGKVHVDVNGDCEQQPGELGIGGVTVRLLDGAGVEVARTTTNSNGEYAFSGLRPGNYTLVEEQPQGYFDGGEDPGDHGGELSANDVISGIALGSGAVAIDYHFCEVPPASLSGFVFQDGPPIPVAQAGEVPNVPLLRDGRLTGDDTRLAGVVVELRNGVTGERILGADALPGLYAAAQPVTVTTNSAGYFEFVGLAPGSYAVFEVQPANYLDGIDTPGSASGVALNPHTSPPPDVLGSLLVAVGSDAILRIELAPAAQSIDNWFSEVVTIVQTVIIPPSTPDPPAPPRQVNDFVPRRPSRPDERPLFVPVTLEVPYYSGSSRVLGYTWHLSVVNGGKPRGDEQPDVQVKFAARRPDDIDFRQLELADGQWLLAGTAAARRKIRFGMKDATPVSGDWNGDGLTDAGIFYKGYWCLDLNGNGAWDDEDLWAKLGTERDKPVTGDWDGDGKTDIGIYGPAWPGDPHAVAVDPGIPDPDNAQRNVAKNLPPEEKDAARGVRTLKLTSQGKPRADLIDHVFFYGAPTDIPVVGDWNGDGIETIAVFRGGKWYQDDDGDGRFTERDLTATFGQQGDKPVVGDFDGDGVAEVAVFRDGVWYIDTNHNRVIDGDDAVVRMGRAGDQPVVGDWDGDGSYEPGVFRQ